jgi:hypothetical protein
VLFAISGQLIGSFVSVLVWYVSGKLLKRSAKNEDHFKSLVFQIPSWIVQQIVASVAVALISGMSWISVVILCLNGPLLAVLQFFSWYNSRGKQLRLSVKLVEVWEQS